MVFDQIRNADKYNFSELILKAFEYHKTLTPDAECGRINICGDDLYASIQAYSTQPINNVLAETHKRYIDIQIVLSGKEYAYWYPDGLLAMDKPYDGNTDAEFYKFMGVAPIGKMILNTENFAVFYPQDIHLTRLIVTHAEDVKKVVYKVAVK